MRRRKPVVMVGVAAVVLLTAAGIAATRAGAEEAPHRPDGSGFSLSDRPGFSGYADDSGVDRDDRADGDDSDDDRRFADDSGFDSGDDSGDSGRSGGGSSDKDNARSVHRAPVTRHRSNAGDGDDSSSHRRAHAGPAGAAHAVQEKPAPQKAAAVPARQHPALLRQNAGGSVIAAAKENVTASDISASPGAPTQQQILTLINGNRRQHGCRGVSLDRRLIGAANGHAADMARHDYFAHESRNGQGAGDRVTDAGYDWKHYGENIARGVDSAYAVVNGWMHSPEHRHNILDCTLHQMGVGLAIAGDRQRTIYWVQDFATPMS